MRSRRSLFLAVAFGLAGFSSAPESRATPADPDLVRTKLTLAPTTAQLDSVPVFQPAWWLTPNVARDPRAVLAAGDFAPELVRRVLETIRLQEDGSGLITPGEDMLDLFTPAQRTRWLVLLGLHGSNLTYRWPLAVKRAVLDRLEAHAGLRETAQRVRRWSVPAGEWLLFGDLWALENSFPTAADRRDFYRAVFETDTLFLKLEAGEPAESAAKWSAYWQVNGRYRAIEPFFNAVRRVEGQDRIDLAHLLPRFARGLLYTFPPEFAAARDLAVESGLVAAGFFTALPDQAAVLDDGLSAWLERECVPTAEVPQFGDILVYEDPGRTRWPYVAVHIADGIVFARQPNLFGAWTFMERGDIPRLNPRLGAAASRVYRRKSSLPEVDEPPYRVGGIPPRWRDVVGLRTGTSGPWGRLASYGVLLAPPGDMLANMPEPSRRPEWTLRLSDPEPLLDDIALLKMPDATRRGLEELLARVRPGAVHNFTLHPSMDLVLNTPGPVRARLFQHLVTGTGAEAYAQTIKIASRGPAEEWFAADSLPLGVREEVLRLTYPLGRAFAISDYGALFAALPADREDRLTAMRTVFRTPALIVLLEKPALAEIPAIAAYWGIDQSKDLTTLLTSFAANDDVRYLDIVHLLPPLAREFMNLYTLADLNMLTASCYWTALNFDVEAPDSRLLIPPAQHGTQSALAWSKLQEDYEPVTAPGRLGDVLAYRELDGLRELMHVCTYVADDVVFTKNGFGLMAPWCLMRLADVDALYLDDGRVERQFFRRKAGSPAR